jgi:hypothetical protein
MQSKERTGLTHSAEVGIEPTFVITKRRIENLVSSDPRAHLLAQGRVASGRAVKLVGERTKQAVSVTERRCGVEPERPQLRVELLARVRRVRVVCLRAREHKVYGRCMCRRRTLPRERVVRACTVRGRSARRRCCRRRRPHTHSVESAGRPASFSTSGGGLVVGGGGGDGDGDGGCGGYTRGPFRSGLRNGPQRLTHGIS